MDCTAAPRLSTSSRKCKGHFRFSLLMSYSISSDPIDMEFYPAAESLIVSLKLQAAPAKMAHLSRRPSRDLGM